MIWIWFWRVLDWLEAMGTAKAIQPAIQETVGERAEEMETTREWFGTVTEGRVRPNYRLEAELAGFWSRFHLKTTKDLGKMVGRGKLIPHDVPYNTTARGKVDSGRMVVLVDVRHLTWHTEMREIGQGTGGKFYMMIFALGVRVLEPASGQKTVQLCDTQIQLQFPASYPQAKPWIMLENKNAFPAVTNVLSGNVICTLGGSGEWQPNSDDSRRALDAFVGWIVHNYKQKNLRVQG